mmetsp:Transcript_4982/g.11358  ORF Transcript_4982/g.11358 Transcript_4982/m.11358 type:complete len:377 (+) Transcript_4982:615-1745(+)
MVVTGGSMLTSLSCARWKQPWPRRTYPGGVRLPISSHGCEAGGSDKLPTGSPRDTLATSSAMHLPLTAAPSTPPRTAQSPHQPSDCSASYRQPVAPRGVVAGRPFSQCRQRTSFGRCFHRFLPTSAPKASSASSNARFLYPRASRKKETHEYSAGARKVQNSRPPPPKPSDCLPAPPPATFASLFAAHASRGSSATKAVPKLSPRGRSNTTRVAITGEKVRRLCRSSLTRCVAGEVSCALVSLCDAYAPMSTSYGPNASPSAFLSVHVPSPFFIGAPTRSGESSEHFCPGAGGHGETAWWSSRPRPSSRAIRPSARSWNTHMPSGPTHPNCDSGSGSKPAPFDSTPAAHRRAIPASSNASILARNHGSPAVTYWQP